MCSLLQSYVINTNHVIKNKEHSMDFFTILTNDPIVAAGVAVIVSTVLIVGYIGYYFVKNIVNSKPK
jgi:hypothetical protein